MSGIAVGAAAGFGDDDAAALRQPGRLLRGQVEQVPDVWYGLVGGHPHRLAYFLIPSGGPVTEYVTAVRAGVGQWILDTRQRPYDQQWLGYQHEISLRHPHAMRKLTDSAQSVPRIPLRHLVALIAPITATVRPLRASQRPHSE